MTAAALAAANLSLPPELSHRSVISDRSRKVDALRRAMHAVNCQRALVFCNFGNRLDEVAAKLRTRGMAVGVLHGGMDKRERNASITAFSKGEYRALLVSDLAARGLDVPDCDAVFNLELPTDETHYVHRAGRTGRMGQPGVVVSIAEPKEAFVIAKFAKALRITIDAVELRGGDMYLAMKREPRGGDGDDRGRETRAGGRGRGGRGEEGERQTQPRYPSAEDGNASART